MKAFLDSSVLVSAFLTPRNVANTVLRANTRKRFQACISVDVLGEVERILRKKPRLRRRYSYTDIEITGYIEDLLTDMAVITEFTSIEPICRDPADDHVLAAALAAKADVIVTGDDDLLTLSRYKNIRIVTVREFLDSL